MPGFVYAQAAPGAFDMLNSLLVPTMLIIGIMYFLMIRPQQRRLKEHRDMVASIRRGDTVVTSGGIIGKVTKVDDNELQVEIADGVKIKLVRSHGLRSARQGRSGRGGESKGRLLMPSSRSNRLNR